MKEGLEVQKRGRDWLATLGFGSRTFGGLGISQEEAILALFEQVLTSFEDMIARAVHYRVVSDATAARVRELNESFVRHLRTLHKVVVAEAPGETRSNSGSAAADDLDDWM